MTGTWSFYRQQPTDAVRNPISGEFFSTEAVGDVTEALVREGIQNTLDARRKLSQEKREPARVHIFLSESAGALPTAKAERWFAGLWPHVRSPGNGLRDQPSPDECCPFLVFEDFDTTGLTGDPAEHQVIDGVQNHFLNFFRAEGHSDKGEQDRGSWGVGKTVFPRTSRISSFFGFTVPNDDVDRMLLGRSVLKYHRVNGQSYKSDGYFGISRDDGFMLPCREPQVLDEFVDDFHLRRGDEPGLSVVIPWYELNGDDGVTRDKVVKAVLRGFFYPILMGHLTVTIANPAGKIDLDQNSILNEVKAMGGTLGDQLVPLLELAEWAQTRTPGEFHSLIAPADDRAQNWASRLVPDEVVEHIRQSLVQRQRLALRVPLFVRPKAAERAQGTFFNVFMEHSEQDTERPLFIRDELIIPGVRPRRINQVRALVIVEDKPLASLLRDAETPAHTQWNPGTGHFKNKYKFGPGVIKFVSQSVSELLGIVNQADQEPDPTLTIEFFSLPALPEDDEAVPARRRKAKTRKGDEPNVPVPPLPPRGPRRFRLDKLRGGFAIRPGDADAVLPKSLRIRVAYDVRRGNPLSKFHPADIDPQSLEVSSPDNTVRVERIEGITKKGLTLLVRLLKKDFELKVTGFDAQRDLYVKADVKERADADQAH